MVNSTETCSAKGAFCELRKKCICSPTLASVNTECLAPYGAPCRVDSDCAQADLGLAFCVHNVCNCTALYRISASGECVKDITMAGSIALLAGSVLVLWVCVIALIGTTVFAIYCYNYRLETNREKMHLIQEVTKRSKDEADSFRQVPLVGKRGAARFSPRIKTCSLMDRPNWKRFRDQFASYDTSRKRETVKANRVVRRLGNKLTDTKEELCQKPIRIFNGHVIRNAIQRSTDLASIVGANVANTLGLEGIYRETMANAIGKALKIVSSNFAPKRGDRMF